MNRRWALAEVTAQLAAVATGREKAELVIRNCKLVNVITAEVLEGTDIAVARGRIALVGDATRCIGPDTTILDAHGQYAAPGFIDGHIHIESSMMLPTEYARAVVPHGTTAIMPDPHEIGNVFGAKGVQMMIDSAKVAPLRALFVMPSCVPAVTGYEDSGETIDADEVRAFLEKDEVCGLGEMMNYPGVLAGDAAVHDKIASTLRANKIVTGHYPIADEGGGMSAYIASGGRCCHETTTAEDALQKLRLGMYVQVREGSAWHDLTEVIRCCTAHKIDTRYVCLASDDTHPHTLLEHGHMDHIVRRAIEEGVDPVTAIQMVTINAAQCFRMDQDIGSITPGRFADIVLFGELEKLDVDRVLINGELVAQGGEPLFEVPKGDVPAWARQGMRLRAPLTAEDFRIEAAGDRVRCRVIEIIPERVGTIAREAEMAVKDGAVAADVSRDILKVCVVERHHGTGTIGRGLVQGFGIKRGAVASTVSHDAHNLQIVGADDGDMALAGNELAKAGGGMIAVLDGRVIAQLSLPIGGLMTDETVQEIGAKVAALDEAWKALECDKVSPFMTMALLPLAVLPELRITNRGLIDTVRFEQVHLFV